MTLSLTMIGDQQVAVAVTQNETLTGGGFGFDNDTQTFLFKSDIGPVMVSLSADGAARQSIHSVSEAMMINYSGQCEARE
ncbi:hypothetical protein ACS3SW_02485 [Roseobacteraceae bacterium S113]